MYKLDIGVIISLEKVLENGVQEIKDLSLNVCQLNGWQSENFTEENAREVKGMMEDNNIKISSLWVGWPGPAIWDFIDGPSTLGLVPKEFRFERMKAHKRVRISQNFWASPILRPMWALFRKTLLPPSTWRQ